MPATHEPASVLPAVSGSSGRLVVSQPKPTAEAPHYPGRVFEDASLSYPDAMAAYVAASRATATQSDAPAASEGNSKAQRQAARAAAETLRLARRAVRQPRRTEDAAWRAVRARRPAEQAANSAQDRTTCRQTHQARQARDSLWREERQQRRATVEQRAAEDAQWRQQRQAIREQAAAVRCVTAWLAILVIVDNCTRQCLSLPLFVTGPHVTAEEVVAALRETLPAELQFVISDRGVHFRAQVFEHLAREAEFVHVVIARHRPQSNGIAERFVRTLKEALAQLAWQSAEELKPLLEGIRVDYNDRPHQGLPIPGLSPNAFAERIWLL